MLLWMDGYTMQGRVRNEIIIESWVCSLGSKDDSFVLVVWRRTTKALERRLTMWRIVQQLGR